MPPTSRTMPTRASGCAAAKGRRRERRPPAADPWPPAADPPQEAAPPSARVAPPSRRAAALWRRRTRTRARARARCSGSGGGGGRRRFGERLLRLGLLAAELCDLVGERAPPRRPLIRGGGEVGVEFAPLLCQPRLHELGVRRRRPRDGRLRRRRRARRRNGRRRRRRWRGGGNGACEDEERADGDGGDGGGAAAAPTASGVGDRRGDAAAGLSGESLAAVAGVTASGGDASVT